MALSYKKKVEVVASSIDSFIGNACMEIGMESGDETGSAADGLYNDPDIVQDLLGDKLYEECRVDGKFNDQFNNDVLDYLRDHYGFVYKNKRIQKELRR